MIKPGMCACGVDLYRHLEDDDDQFECIGCQQLLFKFEGNR